MLEALLQFFLKLLPKQLKDFWDKHESVLRYCYYGAWTSVVSFLTKLIGENCFALAGISLANGVQESLIPNIINTSISWIITVTFAFVVNKKYVFRSETTEKNDLRHEISTFYGARLVTFFLELGLMALPALFKWGKVGYYLMAFGAQFFILTINYVFSKVVVFKKSSEAKQ
ncbi:MAG: GtrA family protein [Oscillospiraceae bacterium]|nr:GtrA family protein [Oscillospiraceae bacterium]